mmetsp:Transcript_126681/g.370136  ORF Transcript_126681/g.370136 Transcript_126681/m.370136 type:complete len:418 (-) Transcript_126681:111-1364(-)
MPATKGGYHGVQLQQAVNRCLPAGAGECCENALLRCLMLQTGCCVTFVLRGILERTHHRLGSVERKPAEVLASDARNGRGDLQGRLRLGGSQEVRELLAPGAHAHALVPRVVVPELVVALEVGLEVLRRPQDPLQGAAEEEPHALVVPHRADVHEVLVAAEALEEGHEDLLEGHVAEGQGAVHQHKVGDGALAPPGARDAEPRRGLEDEVLARQAGGLEAEGALEVGAGHGREAGLRLLEDAERHLRRRGLGREREGQVQAALRAEAAEALRLRQPAGREPRQAEEVVEAEARVLPRVHRRGGAEAAHEPVGVAQGAHHELLGDEHLRLDSAGVDAQALRPPLQGEQVPVVLAPLLGVAECLKGSIDLTHLLVRQLRPCRMSFRMPQLHLPPVAPSDSGLVGVAADAQRAVVVREPV